jgi:hypothetical protein
MSLLGTALSVKRKTKVSTFPVGEVRELALAWAEGKIGAAQVGKALREKNMSNGYCVLACALRDAVQDGVLVLASGRVVPGTHEVSRERKG